MFQISISGQFLIANLLKDHFEILTLLNNGKKPEDMVDQKFIIPGNATPPSIILNPSNIRGLRIKFFGMESTWSGEIPFADSIKSNEAWLVKGENGYSSYDYEYSCVYFFIRPQIHI